MVGVVFGGVELTYFAANLTKVVHGGWLPLSIAAVIFTVMTTWQRGRRIVTARRVEPRAAGRVRRRAARLQRHPRAGHARSSRTRPSRPTPLALRANAEYNHVLHEQS